jgi:anti-sigma factor RsiW
MTYWTTEGHLSELALDLWVTGEDEPREHGVIETHLRDCPECRAREVGWQTLLQALAALPAVGPSPAFDAGVMARVRLPVEGEVHAAAWVPGMAYRLRRMAVAAASVWAGAVLVGLAWLQAHFGVSPAALVASALGYAADALTSIALEAAALLHLSGLIELLKQSSAGLPGFALPLFLAFMAISSWIAIWTLYRVTRHQPARESRPC